MAEQVRLDRQIAKQTCLSLLHVLYCVQGERELDEAFDNFRRIIEALPQSNVVFEKPFRELGLAGTRRELGEREGGEASQ